MEQKARDNLMDRESSTERNLASAIRDRFEPLGGVELDLPPREPIALTELGIGAILHLSQITGGPMKRILTDSPAYFEIGTRADDIRIGRGRLFVRAVPEYGESSQGTLSQKQALEFISALSDTIRELGEGTAE